MPQADEIDGKAVEDQTSIFAKAIARAFEAASKDLKNFTTLIVAVPAQVAAIWALTRIEGIPQQIALAGNLGVLLAIFLIYFVPAFRQALHRKRLADWGAEGFSKDPNAFPLGPFERDDASKFTRADDAVERTLAWIKKSKAQILYVTGESGIGKSSLLHAAIAPKLEEDGWIVSIFRPQDDFFGQFASALLARGVVWEVPPKQHETISAADLLKHAERRALQVGKKLLIIIDQFEEILILGDSAKLPEISRFANEFIGANSDNVRIVVSLRSDFVTELRNAGMPAARHGDNWIDVPAFTRAAAQGYLSAKGQIGPELSKEILREAAEIESRPDRVRPIILNMYGRVLSSIEGVLPEGMRSRNILLDYVSRSLQSPTVRDVAPQIAAAMISNFGTKRPRSITELATILAIEPEVVRGCLVGLSRDGLTRTIDRQQEVWEISHDFVAKLCGQAIATIRQNPWLAARRYIVPVMLLTMAGVVFGAGFYAGGFYQGQIESRLATLGFHLVRTAGGPEVSYNPGGAQLLTKKDLTVAANLLDQVNPPIVSLSLSNLCSEDVRWLRKFQGLRSLSLKNCGTGRDARLPSKLNALEHLTLEDVAITQASWLPRTLPRLRRLDVKNYLFSGKDNDLSWMPTNLPELEFLSIEGSPSSFSGMPAKLPKLEIFHLTDDQFASKLSLLGLPQELPELKVLTLNVNLWSLRALPTDLSKLQILHVNGMRAKSEMIGLPKLDLSELPDQLPSLKSLSLEGAELLNANFLPSKLPNVEAISLDFGAPAGLEWSPVAPRLQCSYGISEARHTDKEEFRDCQVEVEARVYDSL